MPRANLNYMYSMVINLNGLMGKEVHFSIIFRMNEYSLIELLYDFAVSSWIFKSQVKSPPISLSKEKSKNAKTEMIWKSDNMTRHSNDMSLFLPDQSSTITVFPA